MKVYEREKENQMARPRKKPLSELKHGLMVCKCGRGIEVMDTNITEVTCEYCVSEMAPVSKMQGKAWEDYVDGELKRIDEEKKQEAMEPRKGRGRPKKVIQKKDVKESQMDNENVKSGRGRGRPATVSLALVKTMKNNNGQESFETLYSVYKGEREKLGKASGDDVKEIRNFKATMINLAKKGQVESVRNENGIQYRLKG
jgi:pyruvate formate-lyase activating enzyme-like uncharacterized protein